MPNPTKGRGQPRPALTPAQFKKKRKAIFGTQRQAAEALGVSVREVAYWESGQRNVTSMTVILLECIEGKMVPSSKLIKNRGHESRPDDTL